LPDVITQVSGDHPGHIIGDRAGRGRKREAKFRDAFFRGLCGHRALTFLWLAEAAGDRTALQGAYKASDEGVKTPALAAKVGRFR